MWTSLSGHLRQFAVWKVPEGFGAIVWQKLLFYLNNLLILIHLKNLVCSSEQLSDCYLQLHSANLYSATNKLTSNSCFPRMSKTRNNKHQLDYFHLPYCDFDIRDLIELCPSVLSCVLLSVCLSADGELQQSSDGGAAVCLSVPRPPTWYAGGPRERWQQDPQPAALRPEPHGGQTPSSWRWGATPVWGRGRGCGGTTGSSRPAALQTHRLHGER